MANLQRDILERLRKDFEEAMIAAVLKKKGEEQLPFDILTTLHTDLGIENNEIMGQIYFTDVPGADNIALFTTSFVLSEEVDDLHIYELYRGLSKVNNALPLGSFILDEAATTLLFRHVVPLSMDVTADQLYAEVSVNLSLSMQLIDKFADTIYNIAIGQASADDIDEMK